MDIYQQLSSHMQELGLQMDPTHLAKLSVRATKDKLDPMEFLAEVVSSIVKEKRHRSYSMLLRLSGMPVEKTLESFDFSFQPNLDEQQIRRLAKLDFVKAKENVVFLSKPGRGKTHLAIALGLKCIKQGMRVYMASLSHIIDRLKEFQRLGTLTNRKWAAYTRPSLLIIDDVASRALDKQGSELFAELISRRYETGSIIITSNRPFSEWPKVYDSRAAEEAVDKLVHHSTIVTIDGPSYRLKEKLKQMKSID